MSDEEKALEAAYSPREVGRIGRDILNDLVQSITYLEPTKGSIKIIVDVKLVDRSLFGDKEVHDGKLEVTLDMLEPKK